jgi:hypothetical protein
MSAQLHCHILVVYHLHSGDIPFHPVGLELTFLPVGQEVVDRVLQSTLVAMDPRCDGLPGGITNSITVRGPESWSLLSAEDSGSEENLCDGLERGTSLILYRGAVVMPRCSSRARSLPGRTGASAPKDSTRQHLGTSSRPRYRSGEGALHRSYVPCHGPPATAAPQ